MKHPDAPPLPAWIMKKDGRLVPFQEDHICKDLYETGVMLGKPDPFLARELADATSYFLASENPGATLKQEDIVIAVTRTVREFGYPDIALKYPEFAYKAEFNPSSLELGTELFPSKNVKTPQEFNRHKMLNSVLTPDLAAGIQEGWIQMEGITFPDGLLATSWVKEDWLDMVLQSPKEFISNIKNLAAKQIHFEGAEYLALEQPRIDTKLLKNALSVMDVCLESSGVLGVLHLNFPSAPGWFGGLNYSPLFRPEIQTNREKSLNITRAFLDAWIEVCPKRLKMHWHQVGDVDPALSSTFAYLAKNTHNWAFSQVAKPQGNSLANKVDRNVLDKISLRLDKLAKACMRKGILDKFGARLPSLVRLGISAGIQKRAFIRKIEIERRQNEEMKVNLGAGFLLEKARLIVVPKGLPDLLENIFPGKSLTDDEVTLYVKNVLSVLKETVRSEEIKGFISISIDLSHLLEVKESKIKSLVESQRGGPKFNLPIDLQGKSKWLSSLVSEDDLLSVFITNKELLLEENKKSWTKVHSLEW